jgi:hypothetical protein
MQCRIPKSIAFISATCRQINAEVQELCYRKKTTPCVVVDVQVAMVTKKLIGFRIPQSMLPKLQRYYLILDYTDPIGSGFPNLNDETCAAMTSLKHLRIGVVMATNRSTTSRSLTKEMILGDLLCLLRKLLRARVQLQGVTPWSREGRIAEDLFHQR